VLGRPPGVVARMWGGVATGCVWLVLWPVGFVVDGLLIAKALEVVSRSIHATLFDVLPNTLVWGGIGVALYATLAVPLAFGVYGNRRTNGRRKLQAALAALPPDREGGPVRCHSCGAPLDVGPADLGLACLYCGADNLVRMPEAWVAKLRTAATRLGTTIASAAREDRERRRTERRTLVRRLAWLGIFVPVMAGYGAVLDRETDTYPPSWRAAVATDDRTLIPAVPFAKDVTDRFVAPELPTGFPVRLSFDRSEYFGRYSMRSYLLALRRGGDGRSVQAGRGQRG